MLKNLLLLIVWVLAYQLLKYADPAWRCGVSQGRWLTPVVAMALVLFVYLRTRRDAWCRLLALRATNEGWRGLMRFESFGFVIGVALLVPPLCLLVHNLWPAWAAAWSSQITARLPVSIWQDCCLLFTRDLVYAVLIAPVLEEVLYRYVISRELEKTMPSWLAGVLVSMAFSFAHLSIFDTGFNTENFLLYTTVGLYLQWIYRSSGLLAAISVHAGVNLAAFLMVIGLVWQ